MECIKREQRKQIIKWIIRAVQDKKLEVVVVVVEEDSGGGAGGRETVRSWLLLWLPAQVLSGFKKLCPLRRQYCAGACLSRLPLPS